MRACVQFLAKLYLSCNDPQKKEFVSPITGVLTGKVWKHERSIILKSFSKSSLEQSEKAIIQTTQDLIHAVKTKLSQKSPPDDSTISMNVLHLMKMITMDVFGKAAFSHSFGNCGSLALSPVAEAFDFLGRDLFRRLSSGSMLPWNLFYQWPNEANKQSAAANLLLRTFVRQAITDRKSPARSCDGNESIETQESESQNDLLARLMKAHKEAGTKEVNDLKTQMKKKTSSKRNDLDTLTDKVLEDVLISLLFAGYDTTSITLSYALYMLASHDSMYQSCLEEIDRVGVNEDSWENLVLIKAVVKEVLRLFPPGFMTTRTLQKPAKMSDGFVLPPCQVIVSIWAIQRSEENFPHATSFRPDRWASWTGREWKSRSSTDTVQPNDCSNIAAGNEQAFLAFSSGARSCPGQKFAWRELVLVLAGLLKELIFKTIDGYELTPEQFGIVQQPKDGLPMEIGLRLSPCC